MDHNIFIFGHYGNKNTGDDAMIYALLNELSKLESKCSQYVVFSRSPLFVPPCVKCKIKIIGDSPIKLLYYICRSSIFIMGGGTQIYDEGPFFGRLIILMKILLLLISANLFNLRICFINIGIEQPITFSGKALSYLICKQADFISVRDLSSYSIISNMRLKNKPRMAFDLAALLPSTINSGNRKLIHTIGISILPYFKIYQDNAQVDYILINQIVTACNIWLASNTVNWVRLFVFKGSSETDSISDDLEIAELLRKKLKTYGNVEIVYYNVDPMETLKQVSLCDAFIGMRYHSCLFAYLSNIPILIINYFQKCRALGEYIGLSNHAIIELDEVLNGQLRYRVRELLDCPNCFKPTMTIESAKNLAKGGLPSEDYLVEKEYL